MPLKCGRGDSNHDGNSLGAGIRLNDPGGFPTIHRAAQGDTEEMIREELYL